MLHTYCLGILLFAAGSSALYDSSSNVVELTPNNFEKLVTNSDEVWLVEFYAPWCGHCKNLVPEYKKAAKALRGVIKVGAMDADAHKSYAKKYGVSGFPTIMFFTGSKHTPYKGQRTAEAFVDGALTAAKDKIYESLGKKQNGPSDKLLNLCLITSLLVWRPNPDHWLVFYVLAAIWGTADAVWLVQVNALSGILFPGDEEAAYSNFRLWEATGSVLAYATVPYICVRTRLYALLGFLILGFIGYTIIELMELRVKKAHHRERDFDLVKKGDEE